MDEVLNQIRDLCAGKSVEEIEQEIEESAHSERIPNIPVMARYFASLATEPEEEALTGPDDEPQADVDID